jgi:hypothetical protein
MTGELVAVVVIVMAPLGVGLELRNTVTVL